MAGRLGRGGLTAAAPRSAPLGHVNMHCRAVDGIVAPSRVVCAICGHAANLLIVRDLVEQMRQHWRVAGVAAGDLNRSDFQRLLVDTPSRGHAQHDPERG